MACDTTIKARPPRIPPSPTSLAAQVAAFRRSLYGRFDRLMRALEPWYNWGDTFIERMDATTEGPGHFVSLQWLGISFTIFFGRTPPRRSSEEAAAWVR